MNRQKDQRRGEVPRVFFLLWAKLGQALENVSSLFRNRFEMGPGSFRIDCYNDRETKQHKVRGKGSVWI